MNKKLHKLNPTASYVHSLQKTLLCPVTIHINVIQKHKQSIHKCANKVQECVYQKLIEISRYFYSISFRNLVFTKMFLNSGVYFSWNYL